MQNESRALEHVELMVSTARFMLFVSREAARYCAATLGSAFCAMSLVTVAGNSFNPTHSSGSWREVLSTLLLSGGRLSVVVPLYCAAFIVVYLIVVSLGNVLEISAIAIRVVATAAFVMLALVTMIGAAIVLYIRFGDIGFSTAVLGALWYALRGMRTTPGDA